MLCFEVFIIHLSSSSREGTCSVPLNYRILFCQLQWDGKNVMGGWEKLSDILNSWDSYGWCYSTVGTQHVLLLKCIKDTSCIVQFKRFDICIVLLIFDFYLRNGSSQTVWGLIISFVSGSKKWPNMHIFWNIKNYHGFCYNSEMERLYCFCVRAVEQWKCL